MKNFIEGVASMLFFVFMVGGVALGFILVVLGIVLVICSPFLVVAGTILLIFK